MINAWWLLLIVPASFSLGFLSYAIWLWWDEIWENVLDWIG